ncbi:MULTISPECIES: hypothetical protein [Caproicibacterium]|jgi:hypothetical protein|uniref:Uncharacterized protein n=1 Tax=Caproicibacterium lactatifermentans TaxID=2666138 RepID=A0A859DPN0_9FIRM|nr:hypothetical protein [Caproicibacterium lactatifermentans]ARP50609.1 hypothetical protein B6259_06785 [Ruminococcaceae bacterium CPB6]QKN23656.1 hypothetical protein GJQ69_03685 [Caproicibacterium lactatifermentans]QKO29671.1 hypothetical protein GKP14_00690 [Caproicibacterium lactatifermentans]
MAQESKESKKKSVLERYREFSGMLGKMEDNFKLADLLTDDFLQKNTQFQNLPAFETACGKKLSAVEDLSALGDSDVWKRTNFNDAEEMLNSAVEAYVASVFEE